MSERESRAFVMLTTPVVAKYAPELLLLLQRCDIAYFRFNCFFLLQQQLHERKLALAPITRRRGRKDQKFKTRRRRFLNSRHIIHTHTQQWEREREPFVNKFIITQSNSQTLSLVIGDRRIRVCLYVYMRTRVVYIALSDAKEEHFLAFIAGGDES